MAFGKKETNYFECFDQAMDIAIIAAEQLNELLTNYTDVSKKAEKIHDTEHKADEVLHRMVENLSRAFITPIDREDILQIGSNIDTIVDNIEDVANMLDMFCVSVIPEPAKVMGSLIIKSCTSLKSAVNEFKNFKKSNKHLTELIIEVNRYEEEADKFYRKTVKELYQNESNPIELLKWKEIYDRMEDTLDASEDVANLLEAMAIKNS